MMKTLRLAVLVALAIGIWAGVTFGRSGTMAPYADAGLPALIGANLLFSSWVWWRAKPDSGEALVMPMLVLGLTAMLIGILPRLFWPSHEGRHIAGSIASMVILIFATVVLVRNRRRLRGQARTS